MGGTSVGVKNRGFLLDIFGYKWKCNVVCKISWFVFCSILFWVILFYFASLVFLDSIAHVVHTWEELLLE